MRVDKTVTLQTSAGELHYESPAWDDLNEVCESSLTIWEPVSRGAFLILARTARTVVDVGAYTGVYSMQTRLVNSTARVVAFEPNQLTRSALRRNLELNAMAERVEISAVALSDHADTTELYSTDISYGSSMSSLIKTNDHVSSEEVTTATLDSFEPSLLVDLMKVDIEGAEPKFLVGALETLRRSNAILITEALTNDDLSAQWSVLKKIGYKKPEQVVHPNKRGDSTFGDERNFLWFKRSRRREALAALRSARKDESPVR